MSHVYVMPETGRLALTHSYTYVGEPTATYNTLIVRLPEGMVNEAGYPYDYISSVYGGGVTYQLIGPYPAGTALTFVITNGSEEGGDAGWVPTLENTNDLMQSVILHWQPNLATEISFVRPIRMPADGYVRVTDTWAGEIHWTDLELSAPTTQAIVSNGDPVVIGPFMAGTELKFIRRPGANTWEGIDHETYGEWVQVPGEDVVITWSDAYYFDAVQDSATTRLHFLGQTAPVPAALTVSAIPAGGVAPIDVTTSFVFTAPVPSGPALE